MVLAFGYVCVLGVSFWFEEDCWLMRLQETAKSYPPQNSAFVMFHEQIAAHLAKQSLLHHEPYLMRAFSFVLHVYV